MAFKVRILLQRAGMTELERGDEQEIAERPVRPATIVFRHNGKIETGTIDMVMPHDWEKRGVTPTISVVLSEEA